MDVTWIYGAVAIGGIIMTAINGERYRRKYNKLKGEYDKRCKELTNALGEVGRVKLRLDAIINSEGWNLAMRDCKCRVQDKVIGEAMVVMRHEALSFDFRIKSFEYDLNNPEDRDFAIRQAEELIETIKKF